MNCHCEERSDGAISIQLGADCDWIGASLGSAMTFEWGKHEWPRSRKRSTPTYVIVGAGSAGCVMAARLSEDPATRVVLLEAGGHDRHFWIHVPLGYGKTITDPPRQLVLRDRAGTQPERPPRVLAARQGARRLVLDQRPGLHPRPGAGLRPMAPTRQHRLVVRRRAAVFPARRAPDPRRRANCMAPAARSASPTCRTTTRSARRSSRARSTSAIRAMTTSTAPPRKVSATTSSPRATAGVAPPRSAICVRR